MIGPSHFRRFLSRQGEPLKSEFLLQKVNLITTYDTFKEKDLLQFFDNFTSRAVVNLRDAIKHYHHPEERLCFSLETTKGNKFIAKLSDFPKVDKDGHTRTTFIHSMQVLSAIRSFGFSDWKKYSLKMGYDFCLLSFYFYGYTNLPFLLMSTKLSNNNKLIKSLSKELNNKDIHDSKRKQILNSNLTKFLAKDETLAGKLNKAKHIF